MSSLVQRQDGGLGFGQRVRAEQFSSAPLAIAQILLLGRKKTDPGGHGLLHGQESGSLKPARGLDDLFPVDQAVHAVQPPIREFLLPGRQFRCRIRQVLAQLGENVAGKRWGEMSHIHSFLLGICHAGILVRG
jgi:hypothetical protein